MKLAYIFHTKVVGSTFCGGQELLHLIEPGQDIQLIPEPDNKYDPNAVQVFISENDRLGYVPKETAPIIHEEWGRNRILKCKVAEITGKGKANLGANLIVEVYESE